MAGLPNVVWRHCEGEGAGKPAKPWVSGISNPKKTPVVAYWAQRVKEKIRISTYTDRMDEMFDNEPTKEVLQAMIDALPGSAREPGKRFLKKLLDDKNTEHFMEFVDMVEERLADGVKLHKNDLEGDELALLRSTPPLMMRREALKRLSVPVAATLAGGGHAINVARNSRNTVSTEEPSSIIPGVVVAALGAGAANSIARDLSLSFRIRRVQEAVDQLSIALGEKGIDPLGY